MGGKQMKPEAQQIAIAEACGWIIQKVWDGSLIGKPKNEQGPMDDLPDYLHDLNAMHEAEKLIMDESSIIYFEWLTRLSCPWHATAAQRAEAFLRTLNLWKE
jgi:hypothetical protein